MESFEDLISGLIGLYVVFSFIFGIFQASRKASKSGGRPEPKYGPAPRGRANPEAFEPAPQHAGPAADMARTWPDEALPGEGADCGFEGAEPSLEGGALEGVSDAEGAPSFGGELEPGLYGEGFNPEVPPALEGTVGVEGADAGRGSEGDAFGGAVPEFQDMEDEWPRPAVEEAPARWASAPGWTAQGDEPPGPRLAGGLPREDLIFGIYVREVLGPPVALRIREARLRASMVLAMREGCRR